jgi:hypothetical protein
MGTRRQFLGTFGAIGGAALLGGCTGRAADRAPGGAGGNTYDVPLLVAGTATGPVAVRGGRVVTYGATGVVTADAGRVFATKPLPGDRTALLTFDVTLDTDPRRIDLPGSWVPRVTSTDNRLVVLTPGAGTTGPPPPRTRSPIVVASPEGEVRRFDLAGNLEPDALMPGGEGLFVLEWLPPDAPDRYRVRLLDFVTGTTRPLLTRDKLPVPAGAEEEMRGTGRQAVLAPKADVLYTLYTHQPDHQHTRDLIAARPGGVHAFVHCLNLSVGWAYCLDLPHPFGEAAPQAHALAITPDGRTLLVSDLASGRLAVADTESLTLSRVVELPPEPSGGVAGLVASSPGRVFAAAGPRIRVLDGSGAVTGAWTVGGEVRTLALNPDGSRLYVATPDGVEVRDSTSGGVLGRVPVSDVTALHRAP